jgi:hypothetical protein
MVYVKYILASLSIEEKVELLKRLYKEVAGMGINGDTELAHINKHEGAILKMMGGAGTINEETGLIQYFGGSPPPPPAASSTVTQQATIPDEMKPYITDVMTQAQALNKQRTEEGYVPYQGAQIADFQTEQTQAQQGIAGLVGTGQQYFDKASALTEQAGQAPTAEAMQSYMSPYMQNVVDIQKREALRQGDVAAQGQAAQAVRAGAFGGSRDAIIQAENERNQQTLLNDIQAKGQAAAYADAQQQYAAQQKNALAAGQQFGQLGTAVPGQAMKEFGALESVGAAKQQQEQQALNIAKQQFIQEQTFPEANLQQYSSIIRGYNLPPNTYQSAQTTTPAPSYMQQIAGLGMAGAGIAGAFGGFGKKEGGLVGLAKGGKVLRRATGGIASLTDSGEEESDPTEIGTPRYFIDAEGKRTKLPGSEGLTSIALGNVFGPKRKALAKEYADTEKDTLESLAATKDDLKRDKYLALASAGFGLAGSKDPTFLGAAKEAALPAIAELKNINKEERGLTAEGKRMKMAGVARKEGMMDRETTNTLTASKLVGEREDEVIKNATARAKILEEKMKLDASDVKLIESNVLSSSGIQAMFEGDKLVSLGKEPLQKDDIKALTGLRVKYLQVMSRELENGASKMVAHEKAAAAVGEQAPKGGTPPPSVVPGKPPAKLDPSTASPPGFYGITVP